MWQRDRTVDGESVGRAVDHIDSARIDCRPRCIFKGHADSEVGETISVEIAPGNTAAAPGWKAFRSITAAGIAEVAVSLVGVIAAVVLPIVALFIPAV